MRRVIGVLALGLVFLIHPSPGDAIQSPEKHSYLVIYQCTGEGRAETHLGEVPDLIVKSGKSCGDAADVRKKVTEWKPSLSVLLQKLETDLKKIDDWSIKLFDPSKPPTLEAFRITQAQSMGPRVREMMG